MTSTTDLGLSIRVSMLELCESGDWDIFFSRTFVYNFCEIGHEIFFSPEIRQGFWLHFWDLCRPNKLWVYLDMELPGFCPWLSAVLVVGLFKEDEEEITVTSNVVKVQGEDPRGIVNKMGRVKARGGRVVKRRGRKKARVVIPFMGRDVCARREPDCRARGNRRGASPGAAARHKTWTTVPRIWSFSGWVKLCSSLFPFFLSLFLISDFIETNFR